MENKTTKETEVTEELLPKKAEGVSKKKKIVIISIVIAAIIIGSAGFVLLNKTPAIAKELELGQKYLDEGNYEEALLAYENAVKIDDKMVQGYEGKGEAYIGLKDYQKAEENLKIAAEIEKTDYGKVLTADVYSNSKREDEARKLLIEVSVSGETVLDTRTTAKAAEVFTKIKEYKRSEDLLEAAIKETEDKEDLKRLYDKLIDLYVKSGRSNAEIEKILERAEEATGDENYKKREKELIVNKPAFSQKPGEYEEPLSLEITKNNKDNTIYYTLDGSDPTEKSTKYEKAITLDDGGETRVKAIEINQKGRKSEVLSGVFDMKLKLSEEEFKDAIYGAWADVNYNKGGYILSINENFLMGGDNYKGAAVAGDYEVIETTENGGTIIVDSTTLDYQNKKYPIIFDLGPSHDGLMTIYFDSGRSIECKAGEKQADGITYVFKGLKEWDGKDLITTLRNGSN